MIGTKSGARISFRALAALALAAPLATAACGGGQPPVESPSGGESGTPEKRGGSGLGVSAEIGGMPEAETAEVFQRAGSKMTRCFEKGLKRVPYLGGEIRIAVRVTQDGATRWAYVKDSTIGDVDTEQCMLGVIKGSAWPKPVGGEGLTENSYSFEPSPDERPPVSWSPEQLGKGFQEVQPKLADCRQSAGTGALKATFYVDPDGKVVSAGVSGADEKVEAAVSCVVDALRGTTFPSPGSYDAKVSVSIE